MRRRVESDRLIAGLRERSHECLELAGVPAPVVGRAREVLERLEREAAGPAHLEDLPLFAAVAEPAASYARSLTDDAIRALDVDGMSPREALDALYRLKGLLA